MQARNFLRYGFAATRFAGVTNAALAPPSEWDFYLHHPPGMSWTIAATFSLLGESAWAAKLSGFLAALGQVVVTYALVARALSKRAGLAAALATATLPAGAYFSTHGSELGPQVVFFSLLTLWLDERARDRDPARPPIAPVLATLALAILFSWAALPVAAWIAARDFHARLRGRALVFLGVVPAALGLHLLHVRAATGEWGGGRGGSLLNSLFLRGAGGLADASSPFDAAFLLRRVGMHASFVFTIPGLVAAAAGLVAWLLARRGIRNARSTPLFLALLLLGSGYTLAFPQAVVVHRYWLLIALPWIALLIGIAAHVAGATAVGRLVAAALLLALGIDSTIKVVRYQQHDRTPYYDELGTILRERTSPDARIFTSERFSDCLGFYSEREIRGDFADERFSAWKGGDAVGTSDAWFAVVVPSVDPLNVENERLLAYLDRNYEHAALPMPRMQRTLLLFDLSRTKAPPPADRSAR